ncbi:MAG: hypothetical protein CFE38_14780 [Comamonadaceae bacterium PBBC1]|nr:MAG: hypothetical protein CFE38_14780 [Comamonadaceae bacterium PBBC1]
MVRWRMFKEISMSEDLTERVDGFVEMAWLGETPWHGLGQEMQPGDSLAQWQRQAGMDWTIERAEVEFRAHGQLYGMADAASSQSSYARGRSWMFPRRQVLYRSDNCVGLGVVSNRYKEVQPAQVLDFFARYLEQNRWQMSAAGTLRNGAVLWATARTGRGAEVVAGDVVEQYVLLSTSCDGTSSTEARLTNVRVVCANTLAEARGVKASVKVRHNNKFDQEQVQQELQLGHLGELAMPFDVFMHAARSLAARPVSRSMAEDYVLAVAHRVRSGFLQPAWDARQALTDLPQGQLRQSLQRGDAYKKMMALFDGEGRGANMPGTQGTAWGLINAVTEYVDHQPKGTRQSAADRYFSAWLGRGQALKQEALTMARLL